MLLYSLIGFICGAGLVPVCAWAVRREGGRIPPAYITIPLMGFSGAAAFACLFGTASAQGYSFVTAAFCLILLAAALIDGSCGIIPDSAVLAVLALGVASCFLAGGPDLMQRALGSAIIGIPLFFAAYFFDAFGAGDAKLFAAGGFLLGLGPVLLSFLIAVVAAGVFAVTLLLRKKDRKTRFAFGPFIAAGMIIAAIFGDSLITWYISLF